MEDKKYKFFCEACNFKCEFKCRWDKHVSTTLHQTGKKKVKSDCIGKRKCNKCSYESENVVNFKKHILNSHSTKEEREKGFKFYCKLCDFGTFSKDSIHIHKNTDKHKNFEALFNKGKDY